MGTLKREVMGIYVRESDLNASIETVESAIKACREYGERQGYTYNPDFVWVDRVSGKKTVYYEREQLGVALEAAKRGAYTVFVITEIRTVSRRGAAEVFVIFDILSKAGCRLETIREKFEDTPIGRHILATHAFVADIEAENTYFRTQRGRIDRVKNGNLPGDGKAGYGFVWVDTNEPHAKKALDHTIVYKDEAGKEWSRMDVMRFFFYGVYEGISMHKLCQTITAIGIPTPGDGKYWRASSVRRYLRNPEYMGVAVAYRQQKIPVKATRGPKQGKTTNRIIERVKDEQIPLPDGTILEALVPAAVWYAVQEQLDVNKNESLRGIKEGRDEIGILRCGYAHCGICGRALTVVHHNNRRPTEYYCHRKTGGEGVYHQHSTSMIVRKLDELAWAKVVEILQHPDLVRTRVFELKAQHKQMINRADIEKVVSDITRKMTNLFSLAQDSTDKDTIDNLKALMKDLEKQKHQAEALLYDATLEEEERLALETELAKFEQWVENVRPKLTAGDCQPLYQEMRLAVRIIGIHATVFPEKGDFPYRVDMQAQPPKVVTVLERQQLASGLVPPTCGKSGAAF